MDWTIYLKTTETCNLHCKHCFTNGRNGRKIFFDQYQTVEWIKNFYNTQLNKNDSLHIELHGGEPFLAPIDSIEYACEQLSKIGSNVTIGCTTNLVYKLNDRIFNIIKKFFNYRIGTSWDPTIRFDSDKQKQLWENNVKFLISQNIDIKVFVSVTKGLLQIQPIEILSYMKNLGIKEIDFERLTLNGNAKIFPDIHPSNLEQDAWFLLMHKQVTENNARNWIYNVFLENIYKKFEFNLINIGTFCRDCEQKIFTINADGTISGCPNSAPEYNYGTIKNDIETIMFHPLRIETIACEQNRNESCLNCEVFHKCGSDCHQLKWEGNVCPAPKSLFKYLLKNKRYIPLKII